MMTAERTERNGRARTPTATEPSSVPLRPGTLVRIKCAPKSGPYVLLGVVTEEHWGGQHSTHYRLGWLGVGLAGYREHSFLVDAANVLVNPEDNPVEQTEVAHTHTTKAIRWQQTAPNTIESHDRRFSVAMDITNQYTANDTQSGRAARFASQLEAIAWCEDRANLPF
jgi:hypothetical protein